MSAPPHDLAPHEDADAETIARILKGDTEAYAILIARHRDRAIRYAYRMLGDIDDAEDVAQDAFIRAYRSLVRGGPPVQFEAWLFKILVNRCRTAAARRHRRRQVFVEDDPIPERARTYTGQAIARDVGTELEMDEELNRALARLNDAQREAFVLKHVNEMTYEEMTALTGTPIPALKMRVSRACEALRASFAEVYHVS